MKAKIIMLRCKTFFVCSLAMASRSRSLSTLNLRIKMHQSTTSPQLNLNSTTACYLAKKLHLPFSNSVSSNVCSNKPGILAVVRQASTSSHEDQPWYDVDTDELVAMIQQNKEDMLLVDVREPEELQQTGVIPGSINIPMEEVEEAFSMSSDDFDISYSVEKPSMNSPYVVFTCLSGIRSLVAMNIAHQLGYSSARHYKRGWIGWEEHLNQVKNSDMNT